MRSKKLLVLLSVMLILTMVLSSCAKQETATKVPATEAPATEVPAAVIPATEVPATEAPATEVPATEIPATEIPATEIPATEIPATEEVVVEEPAVEPAAYKVMTWSLGETDIPTIDPALSTDTTSNQVNQLVFAGIMNQNEVTAEFENGMATEVTKGEVADDGSVTYTYKLRSDIPWVKYNAETGAVEEIKDCDGNVRYVTAQDFEYAIKRTANPATASDYAFMETGYIVGAADFFASGAAEEPVAEASPADVPVKAPATADDVAV